MQVPHCLNEFKWTNFSQNVQKFYSSTKIRETLIFEFRSETIESYTLFKQIKVKLPVCQIQFKSNFTHI